MTSITPTVRRINFSSPSATRSPYVPGSGTRRGTSLSSAGRGRLGEAGEAVDGAVGTASNSLEDAIRSSGLDVISAFQNGDIANAAVFASQMRASMDRLLADWKDFASTMPASEVKTASAQLESERATWMLVERSMRIEEINRVDDMTSRVAEADSYGVESLQILKRVRTVSEWLERRAGEGLDGDGGAKLKPLDDPSYRWLYSSPDFTPAMDYYSEDDVEAHAEERVGRELWKVLKAGRVEEAEELARSIEQEWRAVSSLAAGGGVSWINSEGMVGRARQRWIRVVAKVVDDPASKMSRYEKGMLALLAGIEGPALKICGSFEERLWVRMSCAVHKAVEDVAKGKQQDLDSETLLRVFLQTDGIGDQGLETRMVRTAQAYLSLGRDVSEPGTIQLLSQMKGACESESVSTWLLRLCTHVALTLRISGAVDNGGDEVVQFFEDVVQAYIRRLMAIVQDEGRLAMGKVSLAVSKQILFELIARLASQLRAKPSIETCSALLESALQADLESTLGGEDRRAICIQKFALCFSKEALGQIASSAIERVWSKNLPSSLLNAPQANDLSKADERGIGILGILVLPQVNDPEELLRRITQLARRFGILQKSVATRKLLDTFQNEIFADVPADRCMNERHELECWHSFFHALARHTEWRRHFFGNRPLPPPDSVRKDAMGSVGLVPYEKQAAANVEMNAYLQMLEEYERVSSRLLSVAVDALRSALTIPGGWMRDLLIDVEEPSEPDHRAEELKVIRSIGAPTLVSLLQNILTESNNHNEAVELVDMVADERLRLYQCFSKDHLQAFLLQARVNFTSYAQQIADARGPGEELYKNEMFQDLSRLNS